MAFLVRSNLQQLILTLALVSTLFTVVNMFIASSRVQKQTLINNTLENNEAYASKLADNAQIFLESIVNTLTITANQIGQHWDNQKLNEEETLRLFVQTNAFNSVVLTAKDGTLLAGSSNVAPLIGKRLISDGSLEALRKKKPLVSEPYESSLNNLVIMISAPIFKNGQYMGYIGGTIYLKEENVLKRLLGEHYYRDGSYIYVFDKQKRILYHPSSERLGEHISNNKLADMPYSNQPGQMILTNNKGVEMLSGYAHIPIVEWTVVAQRPIKATLEIHEDLMYKVLVNSLPINFSLFVLIWFCAWLISDPLRQLAANARNMKQRTTIKRLERISAWYFEADELKRAFLAGLQNLHEHVGQLRHDVLTDPLSKLNNRRALEGILEKCELTLTPFAAIAIDIDHFKRINDTYGHDIGDIVIQQLADLMQKNSRDGDFCIRLGGEEFLILLPRCSIARAADIAERLRIQAEHFSFTHGIRLTISLGVASWPIHSASPLGTLKIADEKLYQAKQMSRNRVCVAEEHEAAL